MSDLYRKKPVEVEAKRYTGDNWRELMDWIGVEGGYWHEGIIKIHTPEGTMECSPGDWIIKGVKGEFYPCNPDIFDMTYEAA